MRIRKRGLMIGIMAVLMISILVPAYAQTQSGDPVQDRDQICEPPGPATRAYGEETPETTEGELLESEGEPTQEQTRTQEQLKDGNCEDEIGEQFQYKCQDQYGQEEEIPEEGEGTHSQERTQNQDQLKDDNRENEDDEQYQFQYKYQDRYGKEE